MSSYLRSVPNKFTSLVNTRRQVANVDHQLSKHVKSSLFLEEFLGTQRAANAAINSEEKPFYSIVPLLSRNVPVAYFNANIERPKSSSENFNWTKHEIDRLHGLESRLYVTNSDVKNRTYSNAFPCSEKGGILYTESTLKTQETKEVQTSNDHKSSKSQLQTLFDYLAAELPLLFVNTVDYTIYTEDLIFVNNIKGTTTVGIYPYCKQIAFLKLIGHMKFAYVKMNVLKMTMHPEENSIKVRWRIIGISGTSIFFTFWKFKFWDIKEQIEKEPAWYDGFSTFYMNEDGKIFKHVVDKLMPDQNEENVKTPIEPKLALFTALIGLDSHYFVKARSKKQPQLFRIT